MKCAHCDAPKARHSWDVTMCADGRKKRVRYLCDEHDIELNRFVLRFMRVEHADEKVRQYKARLNG